MGPAEQECRTRAIPGLPMLINDFQGTSSLPEPVDDEFLTSQGMFPQPNSRTSVLAGFVCLSKIFKILSECFFHHRCLATFTKAIGMEWSIEAEEKLHQTLREMPLAIQDPSMGAVPSLKGVFAMQRANILITAAITKFALVSRWTHSITVSELTCSSMTSEQLYTLMKII